MNVISQIPFTEALRSFTFTQASISVEVQPGEQKTVKYTVPVGHELHIYRHQVTYTGSHEDVQVYFDGQPMPKEGDWRGTFGPVLSEGITLECKNNEEQVQKYHLVLIGSYYKSRVFNRNRVKEEKAK